MSEQSITRTAPGTASTNAIDSHDEDASTAAVIQRRLRIVSLAAAAWALLYAVYRAYYAAGGRFGMFGVPNSDAQWRLINGVGAAILLGAAVTPPAMLVLWRCRLARPALFVLCWIVAVGCSMHALVDMTQCVMSLTGLLTIDRPIWSTIDERQADLQDLLFNEPWFLVEGVLWAGIGWRAGIGRRQHSRRWLATGFGAIAALVALGLLSATGVLGDFTIAETSSRDSTRHPRTALTSGVCLTAGRRCARATARRSTAGPRRDQRCFRTFGGAVEPAVSDEAPGCSASLPDTDWPPQIGQSVRS